MGAIHVHEFMSLDGVIDAPTWTFDYGFDPKMGEAIGAVTARSRSAFPVERVMPATACPAATRSGTSRTPITPLAPAMKIRIDRRPYRPPADDQRRGH